MPRGLKGKASHAVKKPKSTKNRKWLKENTHTAYTTKKFFNFEATNQRRGLSSARQPSGGEVTVDVVERSGKDKPTGPLALISFRHLVRFKGTRPLKTHFAQHVVGQLVLLVQQTAKDYIKAEGDFHKEIYS